MLRRFSLLALVVLVVSPALAQTGRNVRVSVEFHQAGAASRSGAGAAGGVIVTERGGVQSRVRGSAGSSEARTRRTTGVFTLVQDGGEAMLLVAGQVPQTQVAFFRDYATGHGYVVSGVVFRDVGTSLKVRAQILPDRRIRLQLTPTISWFSADSAGTIEFAEATADVVVPNGRPVVLAGGRTETHAVTRQILGLAQERTTAEITVVLTATISAGS
jgi:Flp pilus assembly secretin CpaC